MTGLDFEDIRPTERERAVWLTPQNAQAMADFFGGDVEVIDGVTRLNLGRTSGPARGWITTDGRWLNENAWESADAD